MQEKIESHQIYQQSAKNENNFFLPQILPLKQQRQRLICPNHNQADSVCISAQCSISGLMCLDVKCQCRKIHYKCHHILLDRVLQSIYKHQKEIPQKVKETYKTIYEQINEMIQNLSQLRTKFEREQQYFGLREQQLEFMDLIYEKKIDEVNGKIISSLQKTFDTEIQLSKQSKEEIIKDFQSKRKQFNKMCLSIERKYLQPKQKQRKFSNLFEDSVILNEESQKIMLQNWLNQAFDNPQKKLKSKLLFRASQHKFSAQQFHKACQNKKKTITIIKNQYDKIIGGYTSAQWKSSQKWTFVKDEKGQSFLFSINLKQKYNCLKSDQSIYCLRSRGPCFGANDIQIKNECDKTTDSYGDLGSDYNLKLNNQFKYKYQSQQTRTLFTGNSTDRSFGVKQYEVYQIQQQQIKYIKN